MMNVPPMAAALTAVAAPTALVALPAGAAGVALSRLAARVNHFIDAPKAAMATRILTKRLDEMARIARR
jgi:hypothetical protein